MHIIINYHKGTQSDIVIATVGEVIMAISELIKYEGEKIRIIW